MDEAIERLEELARQFTSCGWSARTHTPAGRLPAVHVSNPDAAAASEFIYVHQRADGTWTYWWPWGEAIATTPGETVAIVTQALRISEP
jgi:hypothetical protein